MPEKQIRFFFCGKQQLLSDEVLRQAAEKCAEAIIASLPAPEDVITSFPNGLKKRCNLLLTV